MKNQFFNQSHFLTSSDFLRLYKTFSLQILITFVKVNPAKIFKKKAGADPVEAQKYGDSNVCDFVMSMT